MRDRLAKTARIAFQLAPAEKAEIQETASGFGMTMSEYLVQVHRLFRKLSGGKTPKSLVREPHGSQLRFDAKASRLRASKFLLLSVILGAVLVPFLASAQEKPKSTATASPAPSPTAAASLSPSPTSVPETPAPSSVPEAEKVYDQYTEGIQRPRLVKKVEASYPWKARQNRLEGVVILELVIGRDGVVRDVKVLKSANPLLDAAAKQAVEQWRYRPATLNGEPVAFHSFVTVSFSTRR